MVAAECGTITKMRGYHAAWRGHVKTTQINAVRFGEFNISVAMHFRSIPRIVEVIAFVVGETRLVNHTIDGERVYSFDVAVNRGLTSDESLCCRREKTANYEE